MRKVGMVPGSQDTSMSPGWVDGRREEFGSIGRMMEHWEEMEKREEEGGDRLSNQGASTKRRSSRKIAELMEKFEEGGGGTDKSKSSNLDKLTGISAIKTKANSSPELSRPTYKSKFQNWKSLHKINGNVTKQKPIVIPTKSVDCDWLQPLANEKLGGGSGVKRKVEFIDSKISKQRVWRGPGNKN